MILGISPSSMRETRAGPNTCIAIPREERPMKCRLASLSALMALLVYHLLAPTTGTARTLHEIAPTAADASVPFIENAGQFDRRARFQARSGRATLWLAEDALWITIVSPESGVWESGSPESEVRSPKPEVASRHAEGRIMDPVSRAPQFALCASAHGREPQAELRRRESSPYPGTRRAPIDARVILPRERPVALATRRAGLDQRALP